MKLYWLLVCILPLLPVHPAKISGKRSHIQDKNGNNIVDYKIVGGIVVTDLYKYPYQAYYRPGGNYICSGSIITKKHVLTAAHCINAHEPHPLHYVIVGHQRIVKADALGPNADRIFGRNKIGVKRFIKRRDGKDIAILQLVRDIEFHERVQPICLPGRISENYVGWDAAVTGWGDTTPYAPEDEDVVQVASDNLREASLTVLEPNSRLCKKARANRDHMLCAYKEGNDACQGDSGGPLAVRENGKSVLIGVVSGGSGCGAKGHTGTYTRVTYFAQWIRDSVGHVCTSGSTYVPHPIADEPNTPPPFVPQTYTPQPVVPQPKPSMIERETCSCSDFVNKNGFGRCKKRDSDFGGSFSCYVNLPSSCPDLVRSGTQPGKFLSAESCKSNATVSAVLPPSTMSPMLPPSSMFPMVTSSTISPIVTSGCSCSSFVNRNGFGRCKKSDWAFTGSKFGIMSCYVNLPSTCVDLKRSGTDPDKFLSTQACANRPYIGAPFEQVTSPSFPVTTDPPVETNPECECSDFVNQNGFGRCRKPDRDFGGSVSCYVLRPSTCSDLVRSGSNPDKFLSAEACRLRSLENTKLLSGNLGS